MSGRRLNGNLWQQAASERSSGWGGATAMTPSLVGMMRGLPAASTSTAPVPHKGMERHILHSLVTGTVTASRCRRQNPNTAIMPVLRARRAAATRLALPSLASGLRARLEPESPSSPLVASRPASGSVGSLHVGACVYRDARRARVLAAPAYYGCFIWLYLERPLAVSSTAWYYYSS